MRRKAYRIGRANPAEGAPFPVLMRSDVPLVYPNLWLSESPNVASFNSRQAYLEDVAVLYSWADEHRIDLATRFSALTGLTQAEISSLSKAVSLNFRNGGESSWATATRRFNSLIEFTSWFFDYYLDRISASEIRLYNGNKARERHRSRLEKARDGMPYVRASNPTSVISEQILSQIASTFEPGSHTNPFKGHEVQVRNNLIFHVLLETWARRSEIVLLNLEHIDLNSSPSITISHPDQRTRIRRRDGASLKTVGRTIPISRTLAFRLSEYIEESRPKLIPSRTIANALFVSSRDGQRLNAKSVNRMFSQVQSAIKGMQQHTRVHPHALRKSGASAFRSQQLNTNDAQHRAEMRSALLYLAGWAPSSRMPDHYTREALQKRVGEIIKLGLIK